MGVIGCVWMWNGVKLTGGGNSGVRNVVCEMDWVFGDR